MLSVPHLDRDFDYLVPAEHSDDAQPGVRVRVRFHGRLVDGFVLERRSDSDHHEPMLARSVAAAPSISGCANKNDMTVPLNPVGMSRLVVIVQHKRR